MNTKFLAHCGAVLCATFCAVGVQAGELGQHPAVLIQKAQAGIDANTFIVGHPARLALRNDHANREHPAVALARQSKPSVDANSFIVQPPASVTWAVGQTATPEVRVSGLAD